ncbi:YafY family transcriptional regulator [Mesorhizobium sp. CA14]|uniref:helix-turn-helix transcriptional regulator n=1 Tax=unclassified Mesorhizobium TaxID=325217 RepID=UPI001CCB848C|nr:MULTISPECIES: YafY family protein [unclassified Mesorhizobium]MBZ9846162.1 YafY family transcriptional regulator [Mesorhizobium sp. CA5]MBZ9847413.1 YafY family transcriptional regulator [Mesorhizobium sp. CA14]
MRRADRLFQLIQILRRSSRPVTAAAISQELEVSKRTVYRDIADLMGQRVPITGEAGFGYILHPGFDMPPLMFTPDEIEAIVLGAKWVSSHSDALIATAASDVVSKIAAVVPDALRPFIAEPSMTIRPVQSPPNETINIAPIRQAIRDGRKLRLRYRSKADETTTRTVWPVILGYSETSRLLVAWCELRQDLRHFRTDRIVAVEVSEEAISLRDGELRRRWQTLREKQLPVR